MCVCQSAFSFLFHAHSPAHIQTQLTAATAATFWFDSFYQLIWFLSFMCE